MVDAEQKLAETRLGIQTLKEMGHKVPDEAYEMEELFLRCVTAEKLLARILSDILQHGHVTPRSITQSVS